MRASGYTDPTKLREYYDTIFKFFSLLVRIEPSLTTQGGTYWPVVNKNSKDWYSGLRQWSGKLA